MSVLVMALNKSGGEASDLELRGMWSGFSLRLLPGSPWHKVVVRIWVPSMNQTDLFEKYSY